MIFLPRPHWDLLDTLISFKSIPFIAWKMAVLRTLVCLAATAMIIQLAMAANYTVGGPSGGWDTSTDLQTWVASQKFAVGDNLSKSYAHINILYITLLLSFMISILASKLCRTMLLYSFVI